MPGHFRGKITADRIGQKFAAGMAVVEKSSTGNHRTVYVYAIREQNSRHFQKSIKDKSFKNKYYVRIKSIFLLSCIGEGCNIVGIDETETHVIRIHENVMFDAPMMSDLN